MGSVELRQAFEWTCDACGRDHFGRCVEASLSEEEEREAKEHYGIEPWQDGGFLQLPGSVTCPDCGATFTTSLQQEDG